MIAVCVTFIIQSGKYTDFADLVHRQAKSSLEFEAECHLFDVCLEPEANEVFLYELYSNKEAFDEHLKCRHFKEFDSKVAGMVASKSVLIRNVSYSKVAEVI